MTTKAVQRMKDELAMLYVGLDALKNTDKSSVKLNLSVVQALIEANEKVVRSIEEGTPFLASYYAYAPEIYVAMDLPWYSVAAPVTTPVAVMQDQAAECDNLDVPTDLCTAIRLTLYNIVNDLCPPPTAAVQMITPCDGIQIVNQILEEKPEWKNVPIFAPDPPYLEHERALDYYTQEFREMVAFIEEHTRRRLDIDRLREVVTESNKQYELWAEYNELKRAVPCPDGYKVGAQLWTMIQMLWPGDPRCTAWLENLIAETELKVRDGIGAVPEEKIRLLWFDLRPLWIHEFASWLEKEWGAVIIMDMFTYNPYTLIDTSTEETMLRGLAKRSLYDVPMIRQERGLADYLVEDITRLVRDYKIDCLVWPAHMGHKSMSGMVGIGREVCRDLGVPFLYLGLDVFDPRYTTADEVKDKMSQFFTAMGLG